MRTRRRVACVAAVFLLAGCSSIADALPVGATTEADGDTSQRGLLPETEQAIDAIVADEMATGQIPGMEVGVWLGGKRSYVRAFGVADLESREPLTTDDHIRIASITKTFTATVILRLVDDKRLSLDDHLSEFVEAIPNGEQITIRQLLNMTAGVYDYYEDPEFIAWMYGDPRTPFLIDGVLDIIRRHGPEFPPGQAWGYSNSNYELLGLVVKKVTSRPIETVVKDRIIDPLDLDDTSYPKTPSMPKPYSHGYSLINAQLKDATEFDSSIVTASAGLVSTINDLRVWAHALITGSLLSRRMQRERLAMVDTGVAEPRRYGLGIGDEQGYLGHPGGLPGYSSAMFSLPKGATAVVLANSREPNARKIALETFRRIASALPNK